MFLKLYISIFFLQQNTGARAYIVSRGTEWKQVTLSTRIVNGLSSFNTGCFRYDATYDEKFIKVLLVTCIGVANIKNHQLNPLVIDFIKGEFEYIRFYLDLSCWIMIFLSTDLFDIRIQSRKVKIFDFETLLKKSCADIEKGRYWYCSVSFIILWHLWSTRRQHNLYYTLDWIIRNDYQHKNYLLHFSSCFYPYKERIPYIHRFFNTPYIPYKI